MSRRCQRRPDCPIGYNLRHGRRPDRGRQHRRPRLRVRALADPRRHAGAGREAAAGGAGGGARREPDAARLAAANPDPVALERMRTAIARHRRAATQHALFDANRAFHLALVDAARNEHLSRLAANLWAAGIGAVILAVQDETPEEIAADADAHAE